MILGARLRLWLLDALIFAIVAGCATIAGELTSLAWVGVPLATAGGLWIGRNS